MYNLSCTINYSFAFRGESNIDFCMQCVNIMHAGGGWNLIQKSYQIWKFIQTYKFIYVRAESRAAATSKMERFVIIVNGWKLLLEAVLLLERVPRSKYHWWSENFWKRLKLILRHSGSKPSPRSKKYRPETALISLIFPCIGTSLS